MSFTGGWDLTISVQIRQLSGCINVLLAVSAVPGLSYSPCSVIFVCVRNGNSALVKACVINITPRCSAHAMLSMHRYNKQAR